MFKSGAGAETSAADPDGLFSRLDQELRVYGGGFWFNDGNVQQEIAGVRTRVEYRVNDLFSTLPGSRLTLEGEFSYDDVRRDKWEIGARLLIPFGNRSSERTVAYAGLTGQELRMMEGLERDTDIVTGPSSGTESVIDVATNVALDRVAIAGDASELGTAVGLGANTLIIAQGRGSSIDVTATDGQALQSSQTLLGGGGTLSVRGASSGTVATFTAPGAKPTLYSADTNTATGIITLADNTHLAGLNLLGARVGGSINGNNGVYGANGLSNIVIERSDISKAGYYAIRLNGSADNVTVSGNTVSQSGHDAPVFNSNNNAIKVTGNSILDPVYGIYFSNNNTGIVVSNNTIIDSRSHEGIRFGSNNSFTISGNSITNSGDAGISINGDNTGTITGNTVSTAGGAGIYVRFDDNVLSITDNIFAGTISKAAVEFNDTPNTLNNGSGNKLAAGVTLYGSSTPTVAELCEVGTAPGFTGSLEIGGTTITDGSGCR
ncbi:right-handed parallel beta-helix repeat-containing protein [Roseibium sp.]|uniref:right-handed parallel beta-helix repeat-containing protein n=1 Tax=Roseibium sp. TaxID=1936156 RepID=UPI003A983FEB